MERILLNIRDILEIFLNFLVVFCLETAVDACTGGPAAPMWMLFLPVFLPFLFYWARKKMNRFLPFLLIHAAAVCAAYFCGTLFSFRLLWSGLFLIISMIYALHSIKLRVVDQEDREREIPTILAGGLAAAAFLLCSYVDQDAGCDRILWITFLYLLAMFFLKYLDNFSSYLRLNRSSTGAMPEIGIFNSGLTAAGGFGIVSVLLLIAFAGTPFIGWLSALVRKAGKALLYAIFWLLTKWSGEPDMEPVPLEQNPVIEMQAGPAGASPVWFQILETILTAAVTAALIFGLLFLIFLLIRFLIRGFYVREKEKKVLYEEGFVEEEERIGGNKEKTKKRLPVFGGTPEEKVRRIYMHTVREAVVTGRTPSKTEGKRRKRNGESNGLELLRTMTAREQAFYAYDASVPDDGDGCAKMWQELLGLYERARYGRENLTAQEVRQAGKLSRQILHTIK